MENLVKRVDELEGLVKVIEKFEEKLMIVSNKVGGCASELMEYQHLVET